MTDDCFRYLIYSQGLPFAITILVLIVDTVGQSYTTQPKDQLSLPNMSKYGCFLGNGIGKNYFSHPIFIYFQSFMLV